MRADALHGMRLNLLKVAQKGLYTDAERPRYPAGHARRDIDLAAEDAAEVLVSDPQLARNLPHGAPAQEPLDGYPEQGAVPTAARRAELGVWRGCRE